MHDKVFAGYFISALLLYSWAFGLLGVTLGGDKEKDIHTRPVVWHCLWLVSGFIDGGRNSMVVGNVSCAWTNMTCPGWHSPAYDATLKFESLTIMGLRLHSGVSVSETMVNGAC